jgi:hypothetical protein
MSATLKTHFDCAVDLTKEKQALKAKTDTWREKARGDGLVPNVVLQLAREHLWDAEQQRKAAERAEIEELYRQGLDLPLFRGKA